MTPSDLETYVRQRYNSVGDSFYPQDEIFNFFYAAQMEIATETFCIRSTHTTTSVASTRTYAFSLFASNIFSIARVEYDGHRIFPNDFIDDDSLTGNNTDEILEGIPEHYQEWNDTLYLRPTPDTSAKTIKLYTYDLPRVPSASIPLDIPSRYHLYLADYALWCMLTQDDNRGMSQDYLALWQAHKKTVLQTERLRRVGDSLRVVKDMDELYEFPWFVNV